MRLSEKEITDPGAVFCFISECSVARIGMLSRGEPYVIPVNFVLEGDTLFFHCAFKGRKQECFSEGGTVCLEFDRMHGVRVHSADTLYTSAIAWGKPVLVAEITERIRILELLCMKYLGNGRTVSTEQASGTCVIAVRLERVTGKENR